MGRTDAGIIDVRARSVSFLRDTLAERQTIRIEFYPPYYPWLANTGTLDYQPADSSTTAANLRGVTRTNSGGGVPAIKTIEIVAERSSGSTQTSATDSSMVSQSCTTATLQEEQSSEARHDNTTVLVVSVVVAAAFLIAGGWALKH